MRRQQLRPLSVGEMVDTVFRIYRSNFVTLIMIAAVILTPILLLSGLLNLAFINDWVADLETLDTTDPTAVDFGDLFNPGAVIGGFILGVLSWVANALASGSVAKAVADTYLGRVPDWQESIRFALGRLAPLLIGSFLFALGVGIGFIFLFVPGIILAVSWSVFAPSIIIEGATGTGGLARSWELIKNRRWPVFGTFVVLYIIIIIASVILGVVLGGLLAVGTEGAFNFGNIVLSIITSVLTAPILAIASVVIYFDLRVRKEAFDVEMLASALGDEGPELPPPGDG